MAGQLHRKVGPFSFLLSGNRVASVRPELAGPLPPDFTPRPPRMSDQNKPKIDLKARLGRKTVGGGGPSIPPPMATGSSIPAPPFASRPPPAAAAALSEPPRPMVVQPQAIKIEMSEEIVEAQKKGRTKVMMIAAGTALVGMLLGYVFGDGAARRTAQNNALVGA